MYESASSVKELGVGINVLPHATRELAELGLLDALDAVGIRTAELACYSKHGQRLWSEPRGRAAGYHWPQLTATTYTFGAPGHSWQIVACTGTSIGEKGMVVAAKALASSAIELYQSPDLVSKAKADFETIRKPLKDTTMIPEGQKAPTRSRPSIPP